MKNVRISNGILFLVFEDQPISVMNELYEIQSRFFNRFDFPSSMVFHTEKQLFNLVQINNIFYIIGYEKNHPQCYEATIRAMNYHRKPGLILSDLT